jgi:hypothetical protein
MFRPNATREIITTVAAFSALGAYVFGAILRRAHAAHEAGMIFLERACFGFLGVLLGLASAGKMGSLRSFQRSLAGYVLLPNALAPAALVLVPLTEASLGLLLLAGAWNRLAPSLWRPTALGACMLFLLFAGLTAGNVIRGKLDLDCGCFGPKRIKLSAATVLRNFFLACLALTLAYVRHNPLP